MYLFCIVTKWSVPLSIIFSILNLKTLGIVKALFTHPIWLPCLPRNSRISRRKNIKKILWKSRQTKIATNVAAADFENRSTPQERPGRAPVATTSAALHSTEGLAARFAVPCLEFVDNWNLRLWHKKKRRRQKVTSRIRTTRLQGYGHGTGSSSSLLFGDSCSNPFPFAIPLPDPFPSRLESP